MINKLVVLNFPYPLIWLFKKTVFLMTPIWCQRNSFCNTKYLFSRLYNFNIADMFWDLLILAHFDVTMSFIFHHLLQYYQYFCHFLTPYIFHAVKYDADIIQVSESFLSLYVTHLYSRPVKENTLKIIIIIIFISEVYVTKEVHH